MLKNALLNLIQAEAGGVKSPITEVPGSWEMFCGCCSREDHGSRGILYFQFPENPCK
jgi:hypothetical protein